MLRIGLTGGIGSGKSSVCRLFAARNIPIIDTDIIARQVVEPGQPGLAALTAAFGKEILDSSGQLDRRALRERVFSDAAQREQLEAILHPLIRAALHRQLEAVTAPYVILAIPLLLEKGWGSEVDRILVVDTDEALQVSRTMARDNVEAKEVERIMQTQVSRAKRVAGADDIIHNEGDYAELERQVEALHRYYLSLTRRH